MTAVESPHAEVLERLSWDTPAYAENLLKILPKKRSRGLIPLVPKPGQLALDQKLEEQRLADKPQRAIVLKSRRVGMSTWVQAKLIQRATLTAHNSALVVAHNAETGGKLFAIGFRMYTELPNDSPELKPPIRSHRRSRFLHFAQPGDVWMTEALYPDSTYWVDTAEEFESGRGAEYHQIHASEYAFWGRPEQKHTALMQTVPDEPDTLIVIESTANGHNHFKDLWDDAMDSAASDYAAFFWPWWKEDDCRKELTEAEREEFRVGDIDQSPYAEEEPELVDPGPIDTETGKPHPLSLEHLAWRRWAISNRCGGKVEKFHQEYPATPEQAFLATGRKVFEPTLVARAMAQAEQTDPRVGRGGPVVGVIEAGERPMQAGRLGKIEVPKKPTFKPARLLAPGETPDWRFWLDLDEQGKLVIPEDDLYVAGVDVSEGLPESEDEEADPAFHAIEVINHRTKEQVCEYRSRCDPDLLAEHALLTAMLFNNAWLLIEKTGPGLHVVRKVWLDFRYQFTYFRRKHESREEAQQDRLGWSTDRATKPILLAGAAELLREETHGIKSRRLAGELMTYIRTSTGKTMPERGRFADLFMSWAIAQQGALELPLRQMKKGKKAEGYRPRNPVTGYGVTPFLILDQLLGRF